MRSLFVAVLFLLAVTCRADPRMHAPCFSYTAMTGSMRPYIWGGEDLFIAPYPISWVRPGMIVLYYRESQHINVLHRVIELAGHGRTRELIVKGDNNPREDPPVTRDSYIGVLVWISHS